MRLPLLLMLVMTVSYGMAASTKKRAKRGAESYGYGGYQQQSYYKPPEKTCYMCAYSPPKTYYDRKEVYEQSYGYGGGEMQYGGRNNGYNNKYDSGYRKKNYEVVPYTVNGGWDKCLGPFDDYEASEFGVDVWECHSNCYVRKDKNGNIFRGCYKGEYGVDPYQLGCHYQGDATYCFCEGSNCNNGPAPGY